MTDKPTGAKPRTVDGVTFRCYRTGILQAEWRSNDGRCKVWSNYRNTGYHASVDGETIKTVKPRTIRATRYRDARLSDHPPPAKRFTTLENAMRAAVKQTQQAKP